MLPFDIPDKYSRIDDLYDVFFLPENLRMHMLRVAVLAERIARHWTGPPLRRNQMRNVLLIHDIGNILKISNFPVDMPETGSKENEQLTLLRKVFDADDHALSSAVAIGIGFDNDIVQLLNRKIFINNRETFESQDFTQKVCAYADQRVAPDGILTLSQRLDEALERYKDKPGSSMNNPATPTLIEFAHRIEAQISIFFPEELRSSMSDKSIKSDLISLRESPFPCD